MYAIVMLYWGRSASTWIAKPEVHVEDVILLVKIDCKQINVINRRKLIVSKKLSGLVARLSGLVAANGSFALAA